MRIKEIIYSLLTFSGLSYFAIGLRSVLFFIVTFFWTKDEYVIYFFILLVFQVHDAIKNDGIKELYFSSASKSNHYLIAKYKIDKFRSMIEFLLIGGLYYLEFISIQVGVICLIFLILDIRSSANLMFLFYKKKYQLIAIVEIMSITSQIVSVLVAFYLGASIQYVIVGLLVKPAILFLILPKRLSEHDETPFVLKSFILRHQKNIIFFVLTTLLYIISIKIEKVVLVAYIQNFADYLFAFSVANLTINSFLKAFSTFFLALFGNSKSKNDIATQLKMTFCGTIILSLTVYLALPSIIVMVYGDKWNNAIGFLLPFCLFFSLRSMTLNILYISQRRFHLLFVNEIVFVALLYFFFAISITYFPSEDYVIILSYPAAAIIAWLFWLYQYVLTGEIE